ncbi:MAG: hypothetical protein AAF501_09925 [Pseudomonadota bacterium]
MTTPQDTPLKTATIEPAWTLHIELADRDDRRIRDGLTEAVGLRWGNYTGVTFESAPGMQTFRPSAGSVAEGHAQTVEMPARVLSFSLPRDPQILGRAIETVRRLHSYEEPVIVVSETFVTRAITGDDRDNPNRWWNRGFKI